MFVYNEKLIESIKSQSESQFNLFSTAATQFTSHAERLIACHIEATKPALNQIAISMKKLSQTSTTEALLANFSETAALATEMSQNYARDMFSEVASIQSNISEEIQSFSSKSTASAEKLAAEFGSTMHNLSKRTAKSIK